MDLKRDSLNYSGTEGESVMFDVVSLGELLIDFTPLGKSDHQHVIYETNPGGAPANVAAAVAKLGKRSAFLGKVGNDQFGHFLEQVLSDLGVDPNGLVFSDTFPTTLAFVHLHDEGERSFTFYRKHSADQNLTIEDVRFDLIAKSKIFHFGSVSLTHEPSASATFAASQFAKEKGLTISYDPNLRIPLWEDLDRAKTLIIEGLKYTDILKISEEELTFITGTNDLDSGSKVLYDQYGIPLILLTLGKNGCFIRKGNKTVHVPAFPVHSIDTTGAGDGFLGAVLSKIVEKEDSIENTNIDQLFEIVRFANAVGALTTTRRGGITSLPSTEEIISFLNRH